MKICVLLQNIHKILPKGMATLKKNLETYTDETKLTYKIKYNFFELYKNKKFLIFIFGFIVRIDFLALIQKLRSKDIPDEIRTTSEKLLNNLWSQYFDNKLHPLSLADPLTSSIYETNMFEFLFQEISQHIKINSLERSG